MAFTPATGAEMIADSRYRSLADAVAELIWVADGEGLVFVNAAWCRYVGTTPERALTGAWRGAVHPDDRANVQGRWRLALAGGDPFEVECRLRRADGAHRWFLVRAAPENGDLRRWLGCCTDIDEQRRAQQTLQRREEEMRLIADAVPSLIAYVDAEQRFRFVNRAYERWYARERAQILGRAIAELVEPAVYEQARPWYEKVLRGQPVTFEGASAFPDGVTRHVAARYLPDFDERGGVRGFLIHLDDVSAHKRAERVLRESEEALAEKARQLAESNAELAQFAYVASHDLQAPLRMVRSFLGLLLKRHGADLGEDAHDLVAEAVDGAERMQGLIKDLLSYAQAGRAAAVVEAVVLPNLLERILHDLAPQIAEAGAKVVSDPLPTVSADRTRLGQVLQNLIGNALKFHGTATPVIRVSAVEDEAAWTIAVADNGIGIPAESHQRIFEAFQRLHAAGEYPGSGIGLAICKKVIEQMGGRVWVESAEGSGATFRFTVPKAPTAPAEQAVEG